MSILKAFNQELEQSNTILAQEVPYTPPTTVSITTHLFNRLRLYSFSYSLFLFHPLTLTNLACVVGLHRLQTDRDLGVNCVGHRPLLRCHVHCLHGHRQGEGYHPIR